MRSHTHTQKPQKRKINTYIKTNKTHTKEEEGQTEHTITTTPWTIIQRKTEKGNQAVGGTSYASYSFHATTCAFVWVSEWMGEWVSDWVSEWVTSDWFICIQATSPLQIGGGGAGISNSQNSTFLATIRASNETCDMSYTSDAQPSSSGNEINVSGFQRYSQCKRSQSTRTEKLSFFLSAKIGSNQVHQCLFFGLHTL